MSTALQHHFHHRVRAQRAVQLIELLAAGGGDGDGHAQVVAAFAFAQFNRGGIKAGIEFLGDHGDGVDQAIHLVPHHLDGELGRVLDQGFGARNFRKVAGCRWGGHGGAFQMGGLAVNVTERSSKPVTKRQAASTMDYRFRRTAAHPAWADFLTEG